MSDKKNTTAEPQSPLIAKLQAKKSDLDGDGTLTLPVTGVVVTYPKFKNHGRWQRAQRQAKKDYAKAQSLYIIDVCKFDGEKMKLNDFNDLIPVEDMWEMQAEIFGGDDDEDGEEAGKLH